MTDPLTPAPTTAQAVAQIREHGVAVLPDLLVQTQVAAGRQALSEVFAAEEDIAAERGWLTDTARTSHLLLAKHDAFVSLWDRPRAVALGRTVLGDDMVLSSFDGHGARPGAPATPPRRDHPFPTPGLPLLLNVICALDPLDERSGAPRLVPIAVGGYGDDAADAERSARDVPLPPGWAVVYDAALWQATAPNATDQERRSLRITFTRAWIQQRWYFPSSLPGSIARQLADDQRTLLGAGSGPLRWDPQTRRVLAPTD